MKKFNNLLAAIILFIGITSTVDAQSKLTNPQSSQKAWAGQEIGVTVMKVVYHSPLVKGREIWGILIPYGEVWRAGANENTIVYFSTDVKIGGKDLKAGKYGLHMIPEKEMWTVIFSKDVSSWGSYHYNKSEDALRVEAKPSTCSMQEWMSFSFENNTANSSDLVMRWEKLQVTVKIEVDLKETVLASMKSELRGLPGFTWEGPYEAAQFCLNQEMNYEEAMVWIDGSIARQENFDNLRVKAGLLEKMGKKTEADVITKKSMKIANENQLNAYGYQLMNQGDLDGAVAIFKTNVERHPNSWNVYDSLAEAMEKNKNKKEAIKNYNKALTLAPDGQIDRLTSTIKRLESN